MWRPFALGRGADRHRLLRDLLLLLGLTGGALLGVFLSWGDQVREDLALEQIQALGEKTTDAVGNLLHPVDQALRTARAWGAGGDLDLADPDALAARFIPMLGNLPMIASLVLADSDGRELFLLREGDAWRVRRMDGPGRAHWSLRQGPGAPAEESWEERTDYDPRTRPWFRGAQATRPERVFWTPPYPFHTLGVPGVTAAVRWQRPGEPDRTYVLGLDLPLGDLLHALAGLPVGTEGAAFLAEPNGAVVLPPAPGRGLAVSLAPGRFSGAPVLEAAQAWQAAGRPAERPFSFQRDGTWWTWMRPGGADYDALWLGLVVAEGDILGALQDRWGVAVLAAILVLALGLVAAWGLTLRYGRHLRTLPRIADRPERFEAWILELLGRGEGATLELKSTLRLNLSTGKPGKEIELAWLKALVAFLNTDGGTLLVGVADDGTVAGLEPDGFENDDRCLLHFKNLVNQHIGPQFSKYLQAEVRPVQGRSILAAVCERSREPAFLVTGKEESFLVRSGPSSMKLTPRQMLQYLDIRR